MHNALCIPIYDVKYTMQKISFPCIMQCTHGIRFIDNNTIVIYVPVLHHSFEAISRAVSSESASDQK